MDGETPRQETSESKTTAHTNTSNSQAAEPELVESKDSGSGTSEGETVGGQGVKVEEKGEKETMSQQQDEPPLAGDTDKTQTAASKLAEGDAEEAGQDKASSSVDTKDCVPTDGDREQQAGTEEDQEGGQIEDTNNNETGKHVAGTEGRNEEIKTRTGQTATEEENVKTTKMSGRGEVNEAKEKEKFKEAAKQGKTKRKSGPPSAVSRPRPSARSIRASAKNDIIAKFQQGAPETPIPRNFKIQKSSSALATGASIKQKMLQWCRNKTRNYEGVSIENFSSSWCNGLAFCALIHRFFPDAFDYSRLNPKEREKNFTLAFQTAETLADCCPLLEVADMLMMGNNPDPMCVFTYVQSLCHSLSKIEKERREKGEEEKKEGEERDNVADKLQTGEDEGGPAENGTSSQEKQKEGEEPGTEGTVEEEAATKRCEVVEDGAVSAEEEDASKRCEVVEDGAVSAEEEDASKRCEVVEVTAEPKNSDS